MSETNKTRQWCWDEDILLQAPGIIFVVVDKDQTILCCSRGFAELLGREQEKIIAHQLSDFVLHCQEIDDQQRHRKLHWKLKCHQIRQVCQEVFCQHNGDTWTFLGTSRPQLDCDVLEKMTQLDNELVNINRDYQRAIYDLEKMRTQLNEQAIRDQLTGLFNRRYLNDALHREEKRAQRQGSTVALLMIDADHFKKVNDDYGHAAGDEVLKQLGAVIKQSVRETDISCRYGGEEFLVVMPEVTLQQALEKAEQLRLDVYAGVKICTDERSVPVSISLGLALYPQHAETLEEALKQADLALYQAKQNGRNQVVHAPN